MSTLTELLWDIEQVANFLGVSRTTVHVYRRRRDFPPAIKLSAKIVRWRPEQIQSWLRGYEVRLARRS